LNTYVDSISTSDQFRAVDVEIGEGRLRIDFEAHVARFRRNGDPVHLVLQASSILSTAALPLALGMPSFGLRLSNAEGAQLLSFIRCSWGNRAPSASAAEVARIVSSEICAPMPVIGRKRLVARL